MNIPFIDNITTSLSFRSPVSVFVVRHENFFDASSGRTTRMHRSTFPLVTIYRPPVYNFFFGKCTENYTKIELIIICANWHNVL